MKGMPDNKGGFYIEMHEWRGQLCPQGVPCGTGAKRLIFSRDVSEDDRTGGSWRQLEGL